jgi:hypothetical protein
MSNDQLQLDQSEAFHRREWAVQRVGWVMWAALIVAALSGLLGSGPLSRRVVVSANGAVQLAYQRFVHHHHPTVLEVYLRPKKSAGDELALVFSQEFLDRVRIHQIQPDALRRELHSDGAIFVFKRGGAETAKIVLHVEYERFGAAPGGLELVGHEGVDFTSFVYP